MIKRNRNAILTICSSFLLLIASIIVVGGSSGKSGKGPSSNPSCGTAEMQSQLTLFDFFVTPSNRLQTAPLVPAIPNLWLGSPSATGLYDSPSTKYYCKVTISNLDCNTWGDAGIKTYVWDSQNKNNVMNIMIPQRERFKIYVEYYEQCGYYWNGSNPVARGRWISEKVLNEPLSIITLNNFYYTGKENC